MQNEQPKSPQQSMIDQQLLITVRNTITYREEEILRMADVNKKYISLLQKYNLPVNCSRNHKKHLKEK